MSENTTINTVALEAFRNRLARNLPSQIGKCLDELTDEQLWWRPNEKSNSVGNLILHICGNLRHYVCRSIGGIDYERDRAAEFSERGPVPREQLEKLFTDTISQVDEVLSSFDPERLMDPIREPGYGSTLFDQIYSIAVHLAVHTGQIVYVTKMLEEGSVDELWVQVLKEK